MLAVSARDRFLGATCHILRYVPVGRRSFLNVSRRLVGNPDRFVMMTDGLHFVVDCRDYDVALRVALNRSYEPVVGALFMSQVKRGGTVFDIGANKGYYTLLAARKVGPSGRVLAYEPDPRNVDDLRRDKSLNAFSQLVVIDSAVADGPGEASFNLGGWEEGNSAWGKLMPLDVQSQASKVNVSTCALDDEPAVIETDRIDIMKMDIQGGEVAAIRGMERSLKSNKIKCLLLELHDMQLSHGECDKILSAVIDAGYSGKCYNQNSFTFSEAYRALKTDDYRQMLASGEPIESYSYSARTSTGAYVKPLQFLFTLPMSDA